MLWIIINCHTLYVQGNTLITKFPLYTADVKVKLFRTFCTPLYTAQIWWNYIMHSTEKLHSELCTRYHSAGQLFSNIDVQAFQVAIRNLIFKFITTLDKLENGIIQALVKIGECTEIYPCHMDALVPTSACRPIC